MGKEQGLVNNKIYYMLHERLHKIELHGGVIWFAQLRMQL